MSTVVSVAALLLGAGIRLWFLMHQPMTGDEAIVSLMARQIRHGHIYTFYWGQAYGGVEPYVAAAVSVLFGYGPVALNATAVALTILSALVVWSLAREVLPSDARWLGLTAAATFWVWPEALTWNSSRELGFRCVTMLAGLLAIKLALRWGRSRRWYDSALLGLVVGIGWWSSPEIVYFLVPVSVIIGLTHRRSLLSLEGSLRLAPLVVGSAAGMLPWLLTNIRSHFVSLSTNASPVYAPSNYEQRFEITLGRTLPMMLSLRSAPGGAWIGALAGQILFALAALILVGCCFMGLCYHARSPLLAACAGGCIVFIFVNPIFPATTYWTEGLYGVFIVPLVILTVLGVLGHISAGAREHRRLSFIRSLPILLVVMAAFSSIVAFSDAWMQDPTSTYSDQIASPSFWKDWSADPSSSALAVARGAIRSKITYAYADYWTAYVLDALGGSHLVITDPNNDRWVDAYRIVLGAPDPAWFFVVPAHATQAEHAFPRTRVGPDGLSESEFLQALMRLKMPYRVLDLGVIEAVVPAGRVTPQMVGLGPPEHL